MALTQDERRQAVEDALKRLPIHGCTCDGCIMYGLGWYCQALCALTAQEHVVLAAALTRPELEKEVPITPIIERIRAYARRCAEQHITQPWFYEIEEAEARVLLGEVFHGAPMMDWANYANVDEWEKTIPGVIGKCDGVLVRQKKAPEPDWRDDVVRALRTVLPSNWGVVKMEGAVSVYTPEHDRVCWFLVSWREDCGKHAIMAVVAEWLEKHPREGV